ncbi:MAG: hypothetical protein ACM3XZ_04820 [Betaproteobacteria bacterium]
MGEIEWFDPSLGAPIVSVAGYGLTFNKAAVEILRGAPKVMLGFDRQRQRIVVKPVPEDEEKGFCFTPRQGYVRIASRDFVRFVARYCSCIRPDVTTRFLAVWNDESSLMEIDLTKPVDVKTEGTPF